MWLSPLVRAHLDKLGHGRAEVVEQLLRRHGAGVFLVRLDEPSQMLHVLGGVHLLQGNHAHVAFGRELALTFFRVVCNIFCIFQKGGMDEGREGGRHGEEVR